jgi:hypothetical protein
MKNNFNRLEKVENAKKFQNEFESFKSRLGKHSVWFNALDDKRKWDLLFLWKKHKFKCKQIGVSTSIKIFLWEKRSRGRFFVSKQKIRESAINTLIS